MKRPGIFLAVVLSCIAAMSVLKLSWKTNDLPPAPMNEMTNEIERLDLSAYTTNLPSRPINLLFIHHSCGGQWLASPGPQEGTNCIYRTHPNGGSLRARLEENSYRVHEASYGSEIGQNTDMFDWLPKFRKHMDRILNCDMQDNGIQNGAGNQIVVFKSCFPNNAFRGLGTSPGNLNGPEVTLWNAKATYTALLDEFRKQPQVLFVCVTAPPLAPKSPPQPMWKVMAKKILGQTDKQQTSSRLARAFNNWLADRNGWLKDTYVTNVVVFDYYDILTAHGETDLSAYPTGDGYDSHPSRAGNEKATEEFIPFLNQAVRRAGLVLPEDKLHSDLP